VKKLNKILSIVICIVMLASVVPVSASAGINTGDYIQLGTYNNTPVIWRCIGVDKKGPLMIADEILTLKAFDASGDVNSGSHSRGETGYRNIAGSNYWADSNIRTWLNSEDAEGNIVWTCGNAPVTDEVTRFQNNYENEAGFLSDFTADEKKLIKAVTQKCIIDAKEYEDMTSYGTEAFKYDIQIANIMQNYENAYSENVTDKVFLLDAAQLCTLVSNLGNEYAKGIISESCLAYTDTWKENGLALGASWGWWLRTPVTEASCHSVYIRYVMDNGTEAGLDYAKQTDKGIRPAFYLDDEAAVVVSGTGEENTPYILRSVPDKISEYGATVAKYSDNIINVSGNAGAENAGKDVTIVLIPEKTYTILSTAKYITNAKISEDGFYSVKFKAHIEGDDILLVKANGTNTAYSMMSEKDAAESPVALDVTVDENNIVSVNLVNKYIDATSAKLIVASYTNGILNTTKVIDYELAFGPECEVQKYVSENASAGTEVRAFLWKSFTDMKPLSNMDSAGMQNVSQATE